MGKKIIDEFTDLPVSNVRKWQLRQRKLGVCRVCREPADRAGLCATHHEEHWERIKNNQDNRRENGLCIRCDRPRCNANFCIEHAAEAREYQRKRSKYKKRFLRAASYQAEIRELREQFG